MKTFGAFIIGDEILRGKRQDKHFAKLIEILAARGLHLSWAAYLPDERRRLVEAFRRSLESGDVVFTFGGIGVTPDDHTRQAMGEAAGVPLVLHPDAEREIRARLAEIGQPVTPARLELGTFPAGSTIIPNPYNRMPGFSLRDHHCLPGFPQMAWPMVEWVLAAYYRDAFRAERESEAALLVWEGLESVLLGLMRRIEADFPGVKVFSLPTLGAEGARPHVELGVRGEATQVAAAFTALKEGVAALGYRYDVK